MDIVKAKKAMEATPEFKDYLKAKEVEAKAWVACDAAGANLHEDLEYGDYDSADEVIEDYKEARKAYKEACKAADKAWKVVEATPEYKAFLKAKEAMEALKETPGYKARRCFNGHNDIKK